MDRTTSISDVDFTAFDFETTGLYPATDRIIEFGGVRFKNGEIIDRFEALVDPGVPIQADIGVISGITDEAVRGAPRVDEVFPRFLDFIGHSVLVAHNAAFDLGFLRAASESLGGGHIGNLVVDTQALAMKAFPHKKSYGLQGLATELRLPVSRAHRALDDSVLCMRLFLACVNEMSFMGELALNEVLA